MVTFLLLNFHLHNEASYYLSSQPYSNAVSLNIGSQLFFQSCVSSCSIWLAFIERKLAIWLIKFSFLKKETETSLLITNTHINKDVSLVLNRSNSNGNLHFTLAVCGFAITFATLKTRGEILASFESTIFLLFQPPLDRVTVVPTEFRGITCLLWTWAYRHILCHMASQMNIWLFPPRSTRCVYYMMVP